MTLEQLRIFVAVAERQHVTQAARTLNLAQSAASHAIAALEARHDTRLFDRIGRHIELTEAGRVFLAEARAVLARAEVAELALSEFGGLKRGTLAVQASQTIASYWLPQRLVAFRRAFPQIGIRLSIGNTTQVAEAVETGTAELGFVEGAVENEHFVSTRLRMINSSWSSGPITHGSGGPVSSPATWRKANGSCARPGPVPDRSSRRPWHNLASRRTGCTLCSNCRRTKPCAAPWRRGSVRPQSPLRLLRRASKLACCTRRHFAFRTASFTCYVTGSAISAAPRMRCSS
jgi:DNA-binding transcriptional LysR family regulator